MVMAWLLPAPVPTQAQELLVADFESFPEGYITRELVDGGIRFLDLDNRFPEPEPSGLFVIDYTTGAPPAITVPGNLLTPGGYSPGGGLGLTRFGSMTIRFDGVAMAISFQAFSIPFPDSSGNVLTMEARLRGRPVAEIVGAFPGNFGTVVGHFFSLEGVFFDEVRVVASGPNELGTLPLAFDNVKVTRFQPGAPVPTFSVRNEARFCPVYYCDPYGYRHFVIAPNENSASITLDASESFDPDGERLHFLWGGFDEGRLHQLPGSEDSPVFTFQTPVGQVFPGYSSLALQVSDGAMSTVLRFSLIVRTPAEVMDDLRDAMDELEEPVNRIRIENRRLLDHVLLQAAAEFRRDRMHQAINRIELFQRKIRTQADTLGPVNAQGLIDMAQAVIDAVTTVRMRGLKL